MDYYHLYQAIHDTFSLESSQGCTQILLKLKFSGSIGEILGNLLATFNIARKFFEF